MDPIKILFEDDALIVAVKPPFVNSEHTEDASGLPDRLRAEGHGDFITPIHRLDMPVCGALLLAKTKTAAAALSQSATSGNIKKEYAALVHGEPPMEGRLCDLLFYDRKQSKTFIVDQARAGVKDARLSYRCIGTEETEFGLLSCLSVTPETGRTHQIRVHMLSQGHPLFNDESYGGDKILRGTTFAKYRQFINNCFDICPRQALHARTLGFRHPRTGKEMDFEAPVPQDMTALIEKWREYKSS